MGLGESWAPAGQHLPNRRMDGTWCPGGGDEKRQKLSRVQVRGFGNNGRWAGEAGRNHALTT